MKFFKVVTLLLIGLVVNLHSLYAVSTDVCYDTDAGAMLHMNGSDTSTVFDNETSNSGYSLEINNTALTTELGFSWANNPNAQPAQSFVALNNRKLTKASFGLKRTGTRPSTNVYMELYLTSSNVPTGSALATSDTITFDSVSTSATLTDFTFSGANQYTLTAGTQYAIVVRLDNETFDGSNYLSTYGVTTNNYSGGQWSRYEGSYNTTYTTYDAGFRIYMQANSFVTVGNAQIDTAQSKFGSASGLFDGSGDYIASPDNDSWTMGTQFTIDFWFRVVSFTGSNSLFGQANASVDTNNFYALFTPTGTDNMEFIHKTGGSITVDITWNTTLSTDTWYHLAFVKDGDDYELFIDGVSQGTFTDNSTQSNFGSNFSIGGGDIFTSLNGWMDEVRVVKDTAIWTTNFTPPSTEYTACTTRRRLIPVTVTN